MSQITNCNDSLVASVCPAVIEFARTPRSELECQDEGGTCEFFVSCWLSGGLLQGTCNGLLQGCCHRTAKSTNVGAEAAGKMFDLTDLPNKDYGPVVSDASECIVKFYDLQKLGDFIFTDLMEGGWKTLEKESSRRFAVPDDDLFDHLSNKR